MKVVILAGGLGTRIGEETANRPKPMIKIGGRPILWHIMKLYSYYGLRDFIICCGYKGHIIKDYFLNYMAHTGDFTIDMKSNEISHHGSGNEPWKITLVDTGLNTMTGGRLGQIKKYLHDENEFCLTHGDGLADINIRALLAFHREHGRQATVTGVYPPARFGALEINDQNDVIRFDEKPVGEGGFINGGFFVLSNKVLDLIKGDETVWEQEPLRDLSVRNELKVFLHHSFWQPMDTMRDKIILETLWAEGKAPWKVWKDFGEEVE